MPTNAKNDHELEICVNPCYSCSIFFYNRVFIPGFPNKQIKMLEGNLSNQVINCFYIVYNTLGYGFLEKVYENALYLELLNKGISCKKQCPIKVLYHEVIVG